MATSNDAIEIANKKSLTAFSDDYLPPTEGWNTWTHPTTNNQYVVTLESSKTLSPADFDACFHLIEFTSGEAYKTSKDGWKPRSKRREMKLLDLKYILVKNVQQSVEGFLSLMPTYEDSYPVIYCYEIHLSSALQGTGLGTFLMQMMADIAARIPGTAKLMLTCFTSNERGVSFYKKLGYSEDEFSPRPKLLRNGTKLMRLIIFIQNSGIMEILCQKDEADEEKQS